MWNMGIMSHGGCGMMPPSIISGMNSYNPLARWTMLANLFEEVHSRLLQDASTLTKSQVNDISGLQIVVYTLVL
jgi:hypothetical protein